MRLEGRLLGVLMLVLSQCLGGCGFWAAFSAMSFSVTAATTAPLQFDGRVSVPASLQQAAAGLQQAGAGLQQAGAGLQQAQRSSAALYQTQAASIKINEGALENAAVQGVVLSTGEVKATGTTGGDGRYHLSMVLQKARTALVAQTTMRDAQGKPSFLAAVLTFDPTKTAQPPEVPVTPGSTMMVLSSAKLAGLVIDPSKGLSGVTSTKFNQLSQALDSKTLAKVRKALDANPAIANATTLSDITTIMDSVATTVSSAIQQKQGEAAGMAASVGAVSLQAAIMNQVMDNLAAQPTTVPLQEAVTTAAAKVDLQKAVEEAVTLEKADPTKRDEAASLWWSAATYTELAGTVYVRDPAANKDPGKAESVTVRLKSEAEPSGEDIVLLETAADSGLFKGSVPFERLFDEQGGAGSAAANGKIAVNGEAQGHEIEARYLGPKGLIKAVATYGEPPSTVTGLIRLTDGTPVGGALVVLGSDSGFVRQTVSRSDGSYAFYDIPPGTYTLTAKKDGTLQQFKTVTVTQ